MGNPLGVVLGSGVVKQEKLYFLGDVIYVSRCPCTMNLLPDEGIDTFDGLA